MTPSAPDLPKLTPKKERALVALLSGATDGAAAKAAGVTRETVNRWQHTDEHFIAAMNEQRAALWRGSRDALRSLVPKAVRVLGAALDDPSAQVRLNAVGVVLRAAGLAAGPLEPAARLTTPSEVREEWASEARSRARAAELDALMRTAGLT